MSVDLGSLQERLYESLKDSGWNDPLKSFLLSEDMASILRKLKEESDDGMHFVPKLKQVFRAFMECPYDKLKLIVVLQSPYQFIAKGVTVADGIAMSCSNTENIQPTLRLFGKEIGDTMYPDRVYKTPVDLKVWSNQGVLLLNTALTTTVGKTDSHIRLWRPFIIFLFDMLSWTNGGLIYAFLGNKAKEYESLVGNNNYKLYAMHPAAAAHQNSDSWSSHGLFPKIEELLIKEGKTIIQW